MDVSGETPIDGFRQEYTIQGSGKKHGAVCPVGSVRDREKDDSGEQKCKRPEGEAISTGRNAE